MKKLIFLLVILLCVTLNAKVFTKEEKKEVMKQFIIFQKAIEEKDIDTLKSMMSFPLDDHSSLLLGKFIDLSDKTINGVNPYATISEEGISESQVMRYKENVFKNLKVLTSLKVNLEKNIIISHTESDLKPEDKLKKYYYDKNLTSYYFYNEKNEKEYKNFCDYKIKGEFVNDVFEVRYTTEPNALTPKSKDSCMYLETYYFRLDNNALKMFKTIAIP